MWLVLATYGVELIAYGMLHILVTQIIAYDSSVKIDTSFDNLLHLKHLRSPQVK